MAAKEGGPVKTKCDACVHTYMSTSTSSKKSPTLQPHMVDSRRSQMSSDLTPVFDREENLDVGSYNGTSSSEESDYNQASVIFSLDELQNLTGLPSSVSPEISTADHNKTVNSGGLLFPGLVQDEAENLSVSSKEEQEERDRDNDHFDINSTSPPVDDHPIKSRDNSTKSNVINDDVILDNKVTKCLTHSANVETQHDMHIVVTSDDNLLCHIDSSVNTMVANAIQPNAIQPNASAVPVTVHPKLSLIYTSIDDSDVALDDYLSPISNNDKLSLIDTPHVETPHVETSSDVVTITHSSPIETPITARLSPISSSSPDNISECAEKPTDSISVSGSIATNNGSMSLYEKLKPTQSVFESPGLLYAHPVKKSSKYVVETLEPAEPATEALIAEEKKLLVTTSQKGSPHLRAKVDKRREIFVDQRQLASFDCRNLTSEAYVFFSECDKLIILLKMH